MPCVYHESPEEKKSSKAVRNENRNKELDKVTRLLCWVMGHVEDCENTECIMVIPPNKELADWWLEHKNKDARRKADELRKIKETAKSKLTKEEIKALGI